MDDNYEAWSMVATETKLLSASPASMSTADVISHIEFETSSRASKDRLLTSFDCLPL